MTKVELARFRKILQTRQAELSGKGRSLENIVIERSADVLEEAQHKFARELAMAGFNREAAIRREVELALMRIEDESFGSCVHCDREISTHRLTAVPWTPYCIQCQEAADRADEDVPCGLEQMVRDAA